jgi:hypothetical protein
VVSCRSACVSSIAQTVTYEADGRYSLGGTWKYGPNNTVVTTVGTASSSASYCVSGDTLWAQRGTNCGSGPGETNLITSVRRRDCGGSTTADAGLPGR